MELKLNPESVMNLINNRDQNHYDTIISPRKILTIFNKDNNDLEYFITHNNRVIKFDFSERSFSQFLGKLKVPTAFFKRCNPQNKLNIFQQFKNEYKNHLLFRMTGDKKVWDTSNYFDQNDFTHGVRATLSDKYSVMDDKDVFPSVFLGLKTIENIEYKSFNHDDAITSLNVEFPDARINHEGTLYKAGVHVSNSETGYSSIWIEPTVTVGGYKFMNRMILNKQDVDLRIVHRGSINPNRIETAAKSSKDIAQIGIIQMIAASKQVIAKDHAVAFAKSITSLPQRVLNHLEEEWENEQEITRLNAAKGILDAAVELPLFQKIAIQQEAGKLMKLFKGHKSRMASIAEDLAKIKNID